MNISGTLGTAGKNAEIDYFMLAQSTKVMNGRDCSSDCRLVIVSYWLDSVFIN